MHRKRANDPIQLICFQELQRFVPAKEKAHRDKKSLNFWPVAAVVAIKVDQMAEARTFLLLLAATSAR